MVPAKSKEDDFSRASGWLPTKKCSPLSLAYQVIFANASVLTYGFFSEGASFYIEIDLKCSKNLSSESLSISEVLATHKKD